MTNEGFEKIAALISQLNAPYISVGNAEGEKYRKAVGAVISSGSIIRFRTTLSLSEGNGDHTYLALFSDATDTPYSGVLIDDEAQSFSKTTNQVLNIECRITVQEVTT